MNAHLHFCVPCYGGQLTEPFFKSFLSLQYLLSMNKIPSTLSTITNESLISRGRNSLVSFFLMNQSATHLMFLDADICFNANDVLKLVMHNLDVVGGAYPMKGIDWGHVKESANRLDAQNLKYAGIQYAVARTPQMEIKGDLVEVLGTGTGFLLIRRNVIETMIEKYPKLKCHYSYNANPEFQKNLYAFFDASIDETGVYLPEDFTFCRRWRDVGGKVYIDKSVRLDHIGHYTFEGNLENISRVTDAAGRA